MGREIVYCWKCATRLQGADFDSGDAFRVGDKVSCPACVDELVADLSAEEQEAILSPKSPSPKKSTSTRIKAEAPAPPPQNPSRSTGIRTKPRTGTTGPVPRMRTGSTGPVPTAGSGGGTGVRKRVTASIPKVPPPPADGDEGEEDGDAKPPVDEKKKKLLLIGGIGGGLFLLIVVLLIVVLTRKPEVKHKAVVEGPDPAQVPKPVVSLESPKEKEVKALLKDAFDLIKNKPEELGLQLKKLNDAKAAAEGTTLATAVEEERDRVLAKIDKAVSGLDEQILPQYKSNDFKPVIETYEKAKALHDVPEWRERIDKKLLLTRKRVEDTFYQFKRQVEDARQAGEEPKMQEFKDAIAKWEMPEFVDKWEKFAALIAAAAPEPEPGKTPDAPRVPNAPAVKPLSPALKAFMPAWQAALGPAMNRDYAAAATEMSGAGARADSEEAKKAGADDAAALKEIGEKYPEILKTAGETAKLAAFTLEFQDSPGVWKKVSGRTIKVEPTRMEFKPDAKDGKDQPAIFIEMSDLNAGSLAVLYKAKKKKLDRKEADLLVRFALIEGAAEAAQTLGGTAPDRFWLFAPEAREKAPKPQGREFEARVLFHQSEFEWRKSLTKYAAIEKSKLLLSDYTSTAIVKKYQPQIAKRAETGKEFVFLPSDLVANGDYNTFKIAKKEDPALVTTKGVDFKDSLFNFVEAEFIALPNTTYKCWVYAGGCCQEVWNGSYQATEGTTQNKGKQVPIDPGVAMAAPLPYPPGLKKTHDEHKPKGAKEHPKTPAKWDWISIPLPKTFQAPGVKQIRILTDQPGFGVRYIIISSMRSKAPDDATAKELFTQATSAPAPAGPAKSEIKGEPQPKQWYLIGPFPEGLATEQPLEKEIDLGKEYKGKTGNVKWKPGSAVMQGAQAHLDWEKNGAFNPKDGVSVYAMIHVKAPAAMDAKLFVSHDDGGRAWVNGVKVHDNNRGGGVKPDEFGVAIKLEEGWNRLLFKVNNGNGGFGLMMRITDASKAAIPGLEYSALGELESP